jgi:hypothetical protein
MGFVVSGLVLGFAGSMGYALYLVTIAAGL